MAVFFFQAEDGIRDWSVTGVQTCALPISPPRPRWARSTGARCARSSTSAPSWRSSRARTAWCTSRSLPTSGCARSPTSSRRATSSRSRCSRWTGRERSGSPERKRSRSRSSRRRSGSGMQVTRLTNGVRVLSEPLPDLTSATVGIWVENGSRYERAEQAGISHFLEHLFFKGTARRTAAQIAQEIDAVGGVLNAFTGKEYTCYYAKVLREHLPLALDLLADIFTQSTFAAEEIERERSVIVQEISQVEDTPDDYVHELFNLAFWPGHPLSRPIAGTAETVSRLARDDFLRFLEARYRPDRVLIAAAGALGHDDLLAVAERYFGVLAGSATRVDGAPPEPRAGVSVHEKRDRKSVV